MRRLAAMWAMVLLLSACSGGGMPGVDAPEPSTTAGSATPSASPTGAAAAPEHVMIVVFENKAFERQAGNRSAPYLNALMARSAVFTRSYGVTHPSQPNYLALFSGSTQGVTSDACLKRFHGVANLGSQLIGAAYTFAGYSEALPRPGFRGCSHGTYAAKHNPWVDFDNVPDGSNQPFTAMPADYGRLPTVSFVIPDLCHDMHDCATSTGDAWARTHLDPYLRWANTHNSLLFITYDEDDGGADNHILTMIAGAGVRPGSYRQRINHYSVLRAIEELYGLPLLGSAATAAPLPAFRR